MNFHTLVLEGDRKAERDRPHISVQTKNDYLRRKWLENRPSLHCRSFYLCRMIEEELGGACIDGSGKITVCAHRAHVFPGDETYRRDPAFHVSLYYLEPEDIAALDKADQNTEPMVMWEILRKALLDIVERNHGTSKTVENIEQAFARILDSGFVREERINRLTKRAGNTGFTAQVYRILSSEKGEGWYVQIVDRRGELLCRTAIDERTRYVDRLGSRLYAKAEWQGDAFVIRERFGKEVFRIDVSESIEEESS